MAKNYMCDKMQQVQAKHDECDKTRHVWEMVASWKKPDKCDKDDKCDRIDKC